MIETNLYPGVSVIIPVYNREKYLREAIDSILNQNYQGSLEIIISDDGSTDRSVEIAKSYQDSRIIIIEKSAKCKSQGAAGARNRGIIAATQPLVCFLDSDDYQTLSFLSKMTDAIMTDASLGYVFCRTIEQIERDGRVEQVLWTRKRILSLDIKYLGLTRSNIINTDCFLFRRTIFEKVGMFNENYTNSEDADLWIRIGEKFKGAFVDFNGAVRRTHEGQQLTKNQEDVKQACIILIANDALQRNYKRKDMYRTYKLKYLMLANTNMTGMERLVMRLKLAIRYPVQFMRHLYLLVS